MAFPPGSRIAIRFYVLTALITAASAIGSGLFLMYLAQPYVTGRLPERIGESAGVLLLGAIVAGMLAGGVGLGLGLVVSRRIRQLIQRAELLVGEKEIALSSPSLTDELGALEAAFGRLSMSVNRFVRDSDILAQLPQGLIFLTPDGELADFSPGTEGILGISLKPYSGRVIWGRDGLFPEGLNDSQLKRFFFQGIESNEPASAGEVNIRLGTGEARLLEMSFRKWGTAGETGALMIVQDATEKQRIREQIRRSDQLAFLGGLTAQLAHQVGTPLTVIRGLAELLRDDPSSVDSRRDYLERILRSTDRINQLVKTLLVLAHPKVKTREPILLPKLLMEVLDLLKEMGSAKIRLEVEPSVPQALGDPLLLAEAFANLIKNALEATPEHGEIVVKVVSLKDGVRVSVRNTGVGIPEEIRSRIFEPFFTTKKEGTGLGLAVVRQLVESHGGRISVDSDEATWTSFDVELPVAGGHELSLQNSK